MIRRVNLDGWLKLQIMDERVKVLGEREDPGRTIWLQEGKEMVFFRLNDGVEQLSSG